MVQSLCHFYKLQNDQKPLYLYNEIPQERTFSYNLRRPNVFESSAKSTDRFTHTYFQNCVGEWNQLDQSIRNCPTISGFKLQLVRLVRPTKKSTFGAHDIEGVRLLTLLRVQFSDLHEHRFRHSFTAPIPCVSAKRALRTMNIFFCTAHAIPIIVRTSLTASRISLKGI